MCLLPIFPYTFTNTGDFLSFTHTRSQSHDDAVTFGRPMCFVVVVVNDEGTNQKWKKKKKHYNFAISFPRTPFVLGGIALDGNRKRTRDRATLPHFWGNARAHVQHRRARLCMCSIFKRYFIFLIHFVRSFVAIGSCMHAHMNSCNAHKRPTIVYECGTITHTCRNAYITLVVWPVFFFFCFIFILCFSFSCRRFALLCSFEFLYRFVLPGHIEAFLYIANSIQFWLFLPRAFLHCYLVIKVISACLLHDDVMYFCRIWKRRSERKKNRCFFFILIWFDVCLPAIIQCIQCIAISKKSKNYQYEIEMKLETRCRKYRS